MRASEILRIAQLAAEQAAQHQMDDGQVAELYRYMIERRFPAAETLARKYARLAGDDFPWTSLTAAPIGVQVAFSLFREVARTLEPWREDEIEAAAALSPDVLAISETTLREAIVEGGRDLPPTDPGDGSAAGGSDEPAAAAEADGDDDEPAPNTDAGAKPKKRS